LAENQEPSGIVVRWLKEKDCLDIGIPPFPATCQIDKAIESSANVRSTRIELSLTRDQRHIFQAPTIEEDFSTPNPDGVPQSPDIPAVRIAEAYKLKRQPVEALGSSTAEGLFLWRLMGNGRFRWRVTV
jgi:hypothetical protein